MVHRFRIVYRLRFLLETVLPELVLLVYLINKCNTNGYLIGSIVWLYSFFPHRPITHSRLTMLPGGRRLRGEFPGRRGHGHWIGDGHAAH